MSMSLDVWMRRCATKYGIGKTSGLVTMDAATAMWYEADVKDVAVLEAAMARHIKSAVATQKFVRRQQCPRPEQEERNFCVLAPYNPTPHAAIVAALDLLRPESHDIIYDIGCGDGRFLAAATMSNCPRIVGVEADDDLVQRARERTKIFPAVHILHADALHVDFSDATKIFLYLVPTGLTHLQSRLADLRTHADIVSYTFAVPGWSPSTSIRPAGSDHPCLYLYPRQASPSS